jgi:hypothetical protein
MTPSEMEQVVRETERSIPTLQMEDGPLTEEQKARELGYLRKVLIEEERRNSQVILLPEDVVPLPPAVAAQNPAAPKKPLMGLWDWVGCFVVGFLLPNPARGQPSGLNPIVGLLVDLTASTLGVALFWVATKALTRWIRARTA